MATETVPTDIAAAIKVLRQAEWSLGHWQPHQGNEAMVHLLDAQLKAIAALDAAILSHLRKADELAATLDRIASGGA